MVTPILSFALPTNPKFVMKRHCRVSSSGSTSTQFLNGRQVFPRIWTRTPLGRGFLAMRSSFPAPCWVIGITACSRQMNRAGGSLRPTGFERYMPVCCSTCLQHNRRLRVSRSFSFYLFQKAQFYAIIQVIGLVAQLVRAPAS